MNCEEVNENLGHSGQCLVVFDHRDSAALFAKAPHRPLAIESRGAGNAKLGYLRTACAENVSEGECSREQMSICYDKNKK